ncbi:MAG: acetolactate synthase large subunit [candidate division NC10 bacterium]|nr:acetolactate synthase large subunit [candidate division NC10 bacterium]
MRVTGSEIFMKCLQAEGVHTAFGHPGGAILHGYDVMLDYPLRHILCRHEQVAIHAVEGYYKASGQTGTAIVTSGPGATNTVTGLTDALMDSMAIVVFTGQVPTAVMGCDAFQEADVVGTTRTCTKHNFLALKTEELPRIIKEAYHIARSGRPGPVLVDLPKDIIMGRAEFKGYPEEVSIRGYNPSVNGHPGQIRKAAELIAAARRPVIYGGGGIIHADASAELTELVNLTQIPTTLTLMGLGALDTSHPLWLGMLGMHGTYTANMCMVHTDLMIAIGPRFDDRVTGKLSEFAKNCKIIHVDIDPTSIRKNVHVDVPIVGDVKRVLTQLNAELRKLKRDWRKDLEEWYGQIAEWQRTHPLRYHQAPDGAIKPQYAIEQIYKVTEEHDPTQAAFPDKLVIDIDGDGSFQMTMQDLITCVQYNLPVKIFLVNNRYLGMVRQWQELFYGKRYSQVDLEIQPDFVKLAEACGAVGLRAERPGDVRPLIEKAVSTPGPVVMDMVCEREENCYPMIPAGSAIRDIIDTDEPIPDKLFQGWR